MQKPLANTLSSLSGSEVENHSLQTDMDTSSRLLKGKCRSPGIHLVNIFHYPSQSMAYSRWADATNMPEVPLPFDQLELGNRDLILFLWQLKDVTHLKSHVADYTVLHEKSARIIFLVVFLTISFACPLYPQFCFFDHFITNFGIIYLCFLWALQM